MACDAHTRVTKANAINPVLNECAGQQRVLGILFPRLFYTFEKHKTLALPLHAFPRESSPTEDKNARQWLDARNRAASRESASGRVISGSDFV